MKYHKVEDDYYIALSKADLEDLLSSFNDPSFVIRVWPVTSGLKMESRPVTALMVTARYEQLEDIDG